MRVISCSSRNTHVLLSLDDFSSYSKQYRVCETNQGYLRLKCMKNTQPSSSLALHKLRVANMTYDQISFTALNFLQFTFFVAELWLHLPERWSLQCHLVVAGNLAHQFVNPGCQLQRKHY